MSGFLKVLAAGMLASIVSLSPALAAKDAEETAGPPPARERKGPRGWKYLDLTPAQHGKMTQNRTVYREKSEVLRASIRERWGALREELKKEKTDRASVDAIASEIKSLQAKLVDVRVSRMLEVKEILNPEQFAKFQMRIQERGGRRGRRPPPEREMMEDRSED